MKVDLNKDPMFEKKESPLKSMKEKELEKQRQLRTLRANLLRQRKQLDVEIVDPLPHELREYKNETSFKTTIQHSKARQNLKKYIFQQQKNLKCLRLERPYDTIDNANISPRSRSNMKADFLKPKDLQRNNKGINIPAIQELFKNQEKEKVLHENRVLRGKLGKAMTSIESNVNKIKNLQYSGKKINQSLKFKEKNQLPLLNHHQQSTNQDQFDELDKRIEKKLIKSQKLRYNLEREKKEMLNHQSKELMQTKNLKFFITAQKKSKKKIPLEGVKSIKFVDGDRKLDITPASSLLFQLNKSSNGRQRKEHELSGLLKNSYQNRDSILKQKSNFYEEESAFNDLNPSNQFKLRQLMDKKLVHRLELSRQQINSFINYLYEVKEYYVILNETILQILKEVREILLIGKVMKREDLSVVLSSKNKEDLVGYPNELILTKLYEMMI